MKSQRYNVLFLCTGNSARSILAEVLTNELSISKEKFKAYSAGSFPKGTVHPLTLELLRRSGIPTESLRSKSWDEFARPGAPEMDFIITVCDQAAGETCPHWPGQPITAHWGVPDPAAAEGDDEYRRRAFSNAMIALRSRIERLACLPFDQLDRLSQQKRIRGIGRT